MYCIYVKVNLLILFITLWFTLFNVVQEQDDIQVFCVFSSMTSKLQASLHHVETVTSLSHHIIFCLLADWWIHNL